MPSYIINRNNNMTRENRRRFIEGFIRMNRKFKQMFQDGKIEEPVLVPVRIEE